MGRNGVGKSTLLQKMTSMPGFPSSLRVVTVSQNVEVGSYSAIDYLTGAASKDDERVTKTMEEERDSLESVLEDPHCDPHEIERAAERLSIIYDEMEAAEKRKTESSEIDDDGDEKGRRARAASILRGLEFSKERMEVPTSLLSGGWRMRLLLARALFASDPAPDLLLLDEPTNHLDLHAVVWLGSYLSIRSITAIIVSHDAAFLDEVCTDMIHMHHKRLDHYKGNYSDYRRVVEEKTLREGSILDAAERQKERAKTFVEKTQRKMASKKSQDPNRLKQAKTVREKKMDRIGKYRVDGKRYKEFSLAKLSESHLRISQKVIVEQEEVKPIHFKLNINDIDSIAGSDQENLLTLYDLSFGYHKGSSSPILHNLTLQIASGSKIAVVGCNGTGKTTLLRILAGEVEPWSCNGVKSSSSLDHRISPYLRRVHLTQHHVEALALESERTVLDFAGERLRRAGGAKTSSLSSSSTPLFDGGTDLNVRSYLGRFGLGSSRHVHRRVVELSGGERMRLALAAVLADHANSASSQHVMLLLDEPTNHLDLETLDALSGALREFVGAVVIVSHNQQFLCGFCNELWIVEDGYVCLQKGNRDNRADDDQDAQKSFGDLFAAYKNEVLGGMQKRSNRRSERAVMAKKAANLRRGAKESSGFI
mmetsp:Transcript_22728/g.52096  ORF Transcript_22728/g.52096 Transcript_22728/m.52096 type:complete len:651 (-) Transcript_22728:46-1998(-)